MIFWYVLLISVFLLCSLAYTKNFKNGKRIIYNLSIIILCIFAGLRINIGDTNTYLRYIYNTPTSFSDFIYSLDFSGEWGFHVLLFFLKKLFFGNCQLVLSFFSTVTIYLILITFKKLINNFNLAIYLFITTATYITLMNGVRQFFVAAIIFYSISLIYNKKIIKFFLLVLVLSTIHRSVLIMIPFYFILNMKPMTKKMYIFITSIGIAYLLYPLYGKIIYNIFINDSSYYYYVKEMMSGEKGSNYLRVLVSAIPIILTFFNRKTDISKEKYFNIIFNLSILNVTFYLFGVKYYIFARFVYYFIPASIVLLCWNIYYLKNKGIKRIVYILCLILYFVYYYYQVSIVWNIPYKSVFDCPNVCLEGCDVF